MAGSMMPNDNPADNGYNSAVEDFRDTEYPMLKDEVYLDHAGTTLYSRSLMQRFSSEMMTKLYGNPHSASSSSQLSTTLIEDTRVRALEFFGADPSEFDLIFVPNATAGIKLVMEALRATPGGFDFLYHEACHTSMVGIREEAQSSLCVDSTDVARWVAGENPPTPSSKHMLFAYPAQSNMDGRRYPMAWAHQLRERAPSTTTYYSLLDAAALASTSPLDLSDPDSAPDFLVVSFYKIFGFPDLGGLIVRRQAEGAFDRRRYFGGGTVDTVVCQKEQWHAPKTQSLHDRLEDGTLPIHNIIALDCALDVQTDLFGSMKRVAAHTAFLTKRLDRGLRDLQHHNASPVCEIYSPDLGTEAQARHVSGSVVAFNIRDSSGGWVSLAEVEKLASLKKFHIRTGGVCNPGGIARALGLQPWEIRKNFSSGFRCGTDNDIMAGKPTGIIRVSLGAMSTISDVDGFISLIHEFYRESNAPIQPIPAHSSLTGFRVHSIHVYPIKSCGGFEVRKGVAWEVKAEGLAWDREWCLLHRGSGQALSQKRHPKMALIRPSLDFETGKLRIAYAGKLPEDSPSQVEIPLSNDPSYLTPISPRSSRVCGEEISARIYVRDNINNYFSTILGVPCVLARFPPGGHGKSMRHAKAHLQQHQMRNPTPSFTLPGSFPTPPTPPDSDTEVERRRILLSNESPILTVTLPSLRALNADIKRSGGLDITISAFRANIVLESTSNSPADLLPYVEDTWSSLEIGNQIFRMLGACRRCHMVCIDQETGERGDEPFVTLSKTRRFDGKIFFGTHMGLESLPKTGGGGAPICGGEQCPTISVGAPVRVRVRE